MVCRKKRQNFVNYAQKGCCILYKRRIEEKGGKKVTIIYQHYLKCRKTAKNGHKKVNLSYIDFKKSNYRKFYVNNSLHYCAQCRNSNKLESIKTPLAYIIVILTFFGDCVIIFANRHSYIILYTCAEKEYLEENK